MAKLFHAVASIVAKAVAFALFFYAMGLCVFAPAPLAHAFHALAGML